MERTDRRWQRERGVEPLSEEEAMRPANEELHPWRREGHETGEADAWPPGKRGPR